MQVMSPGQTSLGSRAADGQSLKFHETTNLTAKMRQSRLDNDSCDRPYWFKFMRRRPSFFKAGYGGERVESSRRGELL